MDEKLEFDEIELSSLVVGYGNLLMSFKQKDFERCENLINHALRMIGPVRYERASDNIEKQINKAVKDYRNAKK